MKKLFYILLFLGFSLYTHGQCDNDTQPPLIDSANLEPLTAQCEITNLQIPTATDNCDGVINGCIQFTIFGVTFCTSDVSEPITESTTLTWSYVDSAGNSTTQTQEITILNDVMVADIENLPGISAECKITSLTPPTATDDCDGQITGTTTTTLPITESTTITWIYTDTAANTLTQTQEVVIADTLAPVSDTDPLADLTDQCEITSLTPPNATDNCDGQITGTTTITLPITESTTIDWIYTDSTGNSFTQTQEVIIADTIDPVHDTDPLQDLTAQCEIISLTPPTATDNCDGQITGTTTTTLPITESITIDWIYSDSSGNTIIQTQEVVIADTIAPVANINPLPNLSAQCDLNELVPPTATDNCDGQITGTTTTTLPITESTTIDWIYIDSTGNSFTQTQEVTIEDTTSPVPDENTLLDLSAQCEISELISPIATDNCDGQITGTTTITLPITESTIIDWIFTDLAGNSTTQTQNVVIEDTLPPVPDLDSLPDLSAECEITSLTSPIASDNCDSQITAITVTTLPISESTTIIWIYSDSAGNVSTQTQEVIILDTNGPEIDLNELPDLTAQCEITSLTPPTATDNCDGQISATTTTTLPITESTTIDWVYTDSTGNLVSQSQEIIIDDTQLPIVIIDNLTTLIVECQLDNLTPPTATDNCDGQITATTTTTLPITESITVDWTYTDSSGNTITQSQEVVIVDSIAPTPNLDLLPDLSAQCEITELAAPTASDCDGQITGITTTSLPITESTTIDWIYTDSSGNTITQSQTVVISDITAPVPDTSLIADINAQCEITTLIAPTATDNCDGQITGTTTISLPITESITINWIYTDLSGNSVIQTQEVIIADTIAPVPDTDSLQDLTEQCEITTLIAPTATDNCDGQITGTTTTTLPITQSTTIDWTYTDSFGNTFTQIQEVVIADTSAPIPDLGSLPNLSALCEITELTAPTATDNCDGFIVAPSTISLPVTDSTTINWTFTDSAGNSTIQEQLLIISNDLPEVDIENLPDLYAQCEITDLIPPTATDDCDGQISATTTITLPITESTTITWTYIDSEENQITQTQEVIITDSIAPVPDLDPLSDLTAQCEITELIAPTATDNCDGQITAITTTTLPITQSITIDWIYTDLAGNSFSQTQEVTIEDTTSPVPDENTLLDLSAQCEITTLTAPTATDNCDGQITGTTITTLPISETMTIDWTFTDTSGNTVTQIQEVIIADTIAPVPNSNPLTSISAQCGDLNELTAPTATDNCDGQITATTTTTLPITESTTITWIYTDISGNTSTQTQEVEIIQANAPTGDSNQSFCNFAFVYFIDLVGTDIQFYDSVSGGNSLNFDDPLIDGQTVYASQIVNGCESEDRFEINIIINEIDSPQGEIVQTFCIEENITIADIVTDSQSVIWYDSIVNGNVLPIDYLLSDDDVIYGANFDPVTGCESIDRIQVQLNIINSTLEFYNLITVNGNELNNKLTITNIDDFLNNRVFIYNRSGQLVWSKAGYNNYDNAFYGKANVDGVFMKNNFLPTGTYYFIVNYDNPCENNELKGFIQINNKE